MANSENSTTRSPLLQLGFRPFFLLAGVAGLLLMGYWLLAWTGFVAGEFYYSPVIWHAHEMLFGYTVAVVAGFILTAARNWTGIDTASGNLLLALCVVWLLGRLLPFVSIVPHEMIASIDMLFLPMLAMVMIKPLWQGDNKVNRVFVVIFLVMALANGLVHAELLGFMVTAQVGLTLMLDMVLLLLLIISGRVMPFFTNMAVPGTQATQRLWVERLTFGLMVTLAAVHLFISTPWVVAILAFALAVVQLVRLGGWYQHGIWRRPVLWVLYTGYGWIVIGFVLMGLAALGLFPDNLVTHALTVGMVGVFTLGMMARVSLGHTGRPMQTGLPINVAFVLLNVAAIVRVFASIVQPQFYSHWVQLSGGLWVVAFVLFLIIYLPILISPRIDGKPG